MMSPTAAGSRGAVVYAAGAWAAIDRGSSCEALTRSQRVATKDKVQAVARFTFPPHHPRWGEIHLRLHRFPRGGASVLLPFTDKPVFPPHRAGWAWCSG